MGPLAHCFIAKKVLESNRPLVLLGAVLPDLGWMDKELNCSELHEGGLKLKGYLERENPKLLLLALGMLTHGVQYGLDKYSDVNWQKKGKGWAHLLAPPLYQGAIQACLVDPKTGRQLAHNLIEWAVEYWLDKKHPDLKNELNQAFGDERIINASGAHLSGCFGVVQKKMLASLQNLGRIYSPKNLSGIEGMVNLANEVCQMILSHGVNESKAKIVLKKATEIVKNEWEGFLKVAIFEIRRKKIFAT